MFALFSQKATLGVWRSLYCESRFEACERLKLFHAKQVVPPNLLPNGRMLAIAPQEQPR
jgi:hypothetical protein